MTAVSVRVFAYAIIRARMRAPLIIVVAVAALLSLLLGVWFWQARQPSAPVTAAVATVLPAPRALPAFQFVDHQGQPFGPANLQGSWNLLFFGFTHCPDVCPNTLSLLQGVTQTLKQEASDAKFRVVFISVDPQRDTPAVLKDYVEYFDPTFIAATGNDTELQKLTGALYMPYVRVSGKGDQYLMEHSGALVLLNPQGQAVAYFSPPLQLRPIVDDLRSLLRS